MTEAIKPGERGAERMLDNVSDYVLSGGMDPDAPCVTVDDVTATRREVIQASEAIGSTLRALGVGRTDVVAVYLANSLEIVPALLAVWASGAAVAPLSVALGRRDLQKVLSALRPACVITSADSCSVVAQSVDGAAIVVAADGGVHRRSTQELTTNSVPDGTALVMHTSGTTGTPKAVLLPHSVLIDSLESVLRMLGARPKSRPVPETANLVVFPLAHIGGLFNMLLTFRNCRHLVLMRRFTVDAFLEVVERYPIPSVVLNPTMIQMLLQADVPPDRLRRLRFIRSGTAPLPASVARQFQERYSIPVLNCYGQTEAGGEVIGWNAGDFAAFGDRKLGSVGRPHPGISIRFLDEHGLSVSDGAIGELCVRSPFAMSGYLAGVADEKFTADGYMRTGDLGYVDDDGFVWLVGRVSDVIVCGGFKVMPDEVEDTLREHPLVDDVMVAGVSDDRLGEVPHAYVVTRGSASEDLPTLLIDHARAALAHYKAPRAVHIVAELPRNANGKLMRSAAAQLSSIPPKKPKGT